MGNRGSQLTADHREAGRRNDTPNTHTRYTHTHTHKIHTLCTLTVTSSGRAICYCNGWWQVDVMCVWVCGVFDPAGREALWPPGNTLLPHPPATTLKLHTHTHTHTRHKHTLCIHTFTHTHRYTHTCLSRSLCFRRQTGWF